MKSRASYADKMRQANREAKAAVIGLVVVVAAWAALGFGVSGVGLEVFHTPLWVITGTVGTWVVAIAIAVFMSKRVIVDVDLDEEAEADKEVPPLSRVECCAEPWEAMSHSKGGSVPEQGRQSLACLEEGAAHE